MEQIEPYVERVKACLQTTPAGQKLAQFPVTSFIGVFSTCFHLISLVTGPEPILNALAASPSATLMNGKIWTVVTSALIEVNTTKFAFFLALTLYGCYLLEEESGSVPVAQLLALTSVSSSLLSSLTFVGVYMTTLNDDIFFSHLFGLGGILVSIAIGLIKSRKNKPGMTVAVSTVFERLFLIPLGLAGYAVLGLRFPLHDALLVTFSFFVSIGFMKSKDFNFSDFFPFLARKGSASSLDPSVPLTPLAVLPTMDPTKERFRARGFKLLDKKLAELEAAPEISLDIGDKVESTLNKV